MSECISVRVPATGANLGCLFDCGAIAVSLYLDLRVTPRADEEIVVRYQGVNADRVSTGADNLIACTLRETLRGWGKTQGFELEIENQIPVGAGMGSSAAAIVGALVASHRLARRPLDDEELVSLATEREGHPDNVAAAWRATRFLHQTGGGRQAGDLRPARPQSRRRWSPLRRPPESGFQFPVRIRGSSPNRRASRASSARSDYPRPRAHVRH